MYKEQCVTRNINITSSSTSCSPPQLDCCGKGDDGPLFTPIRGTLCPKLNPADFLVSQVYIDQCIGYYDEGYAVKDDMSYEG